MLYKHRWLVGAALAAVSFQCFSIDQSFSESMPVEKDTLFCNKTVEVVEIDFEYGEFEYTLEPNRCINVLTVGFKKDIEAALTRANCRIRHIERNDSDLFEVMLCVDS